MAKNYYVVSGWNGIVIQANYFRAQQCVKYIRGAQIYGFMTLAEADEAARAHLEMILPEYIALPEVIELGSVYTVRKLSNAGKSDQGSDKKEV